MIIFELASAMPASLTTPDLSRLGRFFSRTPRLHQKRMVGVRFVSEKEIQRLNQEYRHTNRPTDVLSFESRIMHHASRNKTYLGDLAICPTYARREAKRRGIGLREELIRLLAHGALHLLGYDHAAPKEEAHMFAVQERAVEEVLSI